MQRMNFGCNSSLIQNYWKKDWLFLEKGGKRINQCFYSIKKNSTKKEIGRKMNNFTKHLTNNGSSFNLRRSIFIVQHSL